MGRLIILLLLFVCSICADAQDTVFVKKLQTTFAGSYTDFTVDEVGNIYLIINESQLKKIDRNGDSVAVFNDIRKYGSIHSVDVTNPLKILVFYKSTSTIVILDRLLRVRQVIDLRKSNIQGIKAIRLSYDNNIWLFDELESRIKKIDDNGKLIFQSADLRNVFASAPSFQSIFDSNNSLYLYDPKLGWFTFDYYGAFKKKQVFVNWTDAQVLNNSLIGRNQYQIFTAKTTDFNFKTSQLPASFQTAVKVLHSLKQAYILFPDRLEIYDAL